MGVDPTQVVQKSIEDTGGNPWGIASVVAGVVIGAVVGSSQPVPNTARCVDFSDAGEGAVHCEEIVTGPPDVMKQMANIGGGGALGSLGGLLVFFAVRLATGKTQ